MRHINLYIFLSFFFHIGDFDPPFVKNFIIAIFIKQALGLLSANVGCFVKRFRLPWNQKSFGFLIDKGGDMLLLKWKSLLVRRVIVPSHNLQIIIHFYVKRVVSEEFQISTLLKNKVFSVPPSKISYPLLNFDCCPISCIWFSYIFLHSFP